jgi:hypothetical protein
MYRDNVEPMALYFESDEIPFPPCRRWHISKVGCEMGF